MSPVSTSLGIIWRMLAAAWKLTRRGRLGHALSHTLSTLWRHGPRAVQSELALHLAQNAAFDSWVKAFDQLQPDDLARLRQVLATLSRRPLFSLLMPTYNTPLIWLEAVVASVRSQIYPHWELCIADDASTNPEVRSCLARLAAADSRIRVHYRKCNGHISRASNDALALAHGEFVGLLDHDDLLPPHALAVVALALAVRPDADLIYSDEDKVDLAGGRYDPYFKPDWNPELFRCQNLVSHFGVYRTALVREVGGFRPGFEGSQDWDLALRISERTASSRIQHLPFILYHWRSVPGSTATGVDAKSYAVDAGRRAVAEHLARIGLQGDLIHQRSGQFRIRYALPSPAPRVSLLVAINGAYEEEALRRHLGGWLDRAGMPIHEVVLSGATELTEPVTTRAVTCVDVGSAVTHADRQALAARRATGRVLMFLSPCLCATEDGWLAELVSHAMQPHVGAVGTRLLAGNGTVHGGGYILGLGGSAGPHHGGIGFGDPGYMGRAQLQQNLSAVSGDAMAILREHYDAVGGLDADTFPEQWADVDLCLRLRTFGLWNVWTPHTALTYAPPPKHRNTTPEADSKLRSRWGKWLDNDPAYNPNLSLAWRLPVAAMPRHTLPWHPGPLT